MFLVEISMEDIMASPKSHTIELEKIVSLLERFPLPGGASLFQLIDALAEAGGQSFLVGGFVRDLFMNREPEDLDIEVFRLSPEELEDIVRSFVPINVVGRAFSVFKVEGTDIEFSLPRKESKIGSGHRGFDIRCDPALSFYEASRRRDFTINAMGVSLSDLSVFDPWNGMVDIANHHLDIVDQSTFSDDPLRVLRASQFLSRLNFEPSNRLITCSRKMHLEDLPRERIFCEFEKMLLGEKPSRGAEFLVATGWIRYFPEWAALIGVPQDPVWHPEGDVWDHTLNALDEAVSLRYGCKRRDILLMFGVLCHDFGKAVTTNRRDGRFRSIGHSQAGVYRTETFMKRMTDDKLLIAGVRKLVGEHLSPQFLYRQGAGPSAIRRLARRLAPELSIEILERCARADFRASGVGSVDDFLAGTWLSEQADAHLVRYEPEPPVLMGRHLLEIGLKPGPHFGIILRRAYEIQLDDGERDKIVLRTRVLNEFNEGILHADAD